MTPGEWIALVALALSVIVPTLASWRASIVRDARLEAKVDALLGRVATIEADTERHGEEDDHRFERVTDRLDEVDRRSSRNASAIARVTDRLDRLDPHRSGP